MPKVANTAQQFFFWPRSTTTSIAGAPRVCWVCGGLVCGLVHTRSITAQSLHLPPHHLPRPLRLLPPSAAPLTYSHASHHSHASLVVHIFPLLSPSLLRLSFAQVICLSDLANDFINPHDSSNRINKLAGDRHILSRSRTRTRPACINSCVRTRPLAHILSFMHSRNNTVWMGASVKTHTRQKLKK